MQVKGRVSWTHAAWLVAALLSSVSVGKSTFVGTATDTSAYVASARMWIDGTLVRAVPAQLLPGLVDSPEALSPLGFRPGPASGTEVAIYPPGWPLLMAAATVVGRGELAAFCLGPLMYGCMFLAIFSIARRIAQPGFALVAAINATALPVTFYHAIHPMSDVPTTALWLAAVVLALKRSLWGSLTSGVTVALAVLARPNLAPLLTAPLMAILPWPLRPLSWKRLKSVVVFLLVVTLGVTFLVTLQSRLYGSWTSSGYGDVSALFSRSYAVSNAHNYGRMLLEHVGAPSAVLTLLSCVAVCALPSTRRNRVVATAAVLLCINGAMYVLYLPFDHWPFLRFLLPGVCAAAILSAAGWHGLWLRQKTPLSRLAVVSGMIAQCAFGATNRPDLWHYSWNAWQDQRRVLTMARYLADALPPNAVVLGFIHTGTIVDYTRHRTVRLDLVSPQQLERTVERLTALGWAPALVLDQELEAAEFRRRFSATRFGRLEWTPRARFIAAGETTYWLMSDQNSDPPPHTDVLRSNHRY